MGWRGAEDETLSKDPRSALKGEENRDPYRRLVVVIVQGQDGTVHDDGDEHVAVEPMPLLFEPNGRRILSSRWQAQQLCVQEPRACTGQTLLGKRLPMTTYGKESVNNTTAASSLSSSQSNLSQSKVPMNCSTSPEVEEICPEFEDLPRHLLRPLEMLFQIASVMVTHNMEQSSSMTHAHMNVIPSETRSSGHTIGRRVASPARRHSTLPRKAEFGLDGGAPDDAARRTTEEPRVRWRTRDVIRLFRNWHPNREQSR